jgi:hypothetical protein
MTIGIEEDDGAEGVVAASLVDALIVYAEPLTAGAHVLVLGDAESSVAERLLDLGARGVHVFDPDPARAANASRNAPRGVTIRSLVGDVDVRDGAFDLAIVPDLAALDEPRSTIARLGRAVGRSGAVVAMGRAKLDEEAEELEVHFGQELGPAVLAYAELYDVFAAQFEDVSLAGVVPFQGVVFAELGSEDEAPAVSVDTRLAVSPAPSIFVVVASSQAPAAARGGERAGRPSLDPYAIVQLPEAAEAPREDAVALESAFAATQLKAELLTAQLDETRDRLVISDARTVEAVNRLDRAVAERDAALTRAMELEVVLGASQQTMGALERRVLESEQGMLERDDRIAALSAELDARRSAAAPAEPVDVSELVTRAERAEAALAAALADIAQREEEAATHVETKLPDINELIARAERAESALALNVADLAQVAEAHAAETASWEEQLTGRAKVITELEKELMRREQLVKELVTSLEDAREGVSIGHVFEAAPPLSVPVPRPDPALREEIARLRSKLDELASEVARREGELTARAWRITELENERTRLVHDIAQHAARPEAPSQPAASETSEPGEAVAALAHARSELDALRQALAQEHAARVAAESGEELAHARAELARQAALLEQLRGRIES